MILAAVFRASALARAAPTRTYPKGQGTSENLRWRFSDGLSESDVVTKAVARRRGENCRQKGDFTRDGSFATGSLDQAMEMLLHFPHIGFDGVEIPVPRLFTRDLIRISQIFFMDPLEVGGDLGRVDPDNDLIVP